MASDVQLSDIDLNLLVALDALLEESHVSQAASRVGLSQPAMSHALRRLRAMLGDELLVRGRGGMRLTPRAEELRTPVRRGLLELQRAIRQPGVFDPGTARRRFSICAIDYLEVQMLPHVMEILREEAPHVDLQVVPGEMQIEWLELGKVDLWIWANPNERSGILRRKLFDDHFACLVREGHPDIDGSLSLEQYLAWPHALVSPRGRDGSIVSSILEKIGESRRIALQVPHFLSAPMLVQRSNMILTVSRRVACYFAAMLPLQVLEPPIEISSYGVYMVWHERFQQDPAHKWFRDVLLRADQRSEAEQRDVVCGARG